MQKQHVSRAAIVSCAGHLILGLGVAAFFLLFPPPLLALAAGPLALATEIGRGPRIRASPRYCVRERRTGAVGRDPFAGGGAKFEHSRNFFAIFVAIVK